MATVNINIFKVNIGEVDEEEVEEAGKSNDYYTHVPSIRKIIIIIINLCNTNQHNYCFIIKIFIISVMKTEIHLFIIIIITIG